MKAILIVSVTLAAIVIIPSGAGSQTKTEPSQPKRFAPTPPVPATYDPQSGPFIVRLNAQGEVGAEQYGVIANAVKSWSGTNLQAFVICFRSQHDPVVWGTAFKALSTVAHELKVHGAKAVVMSNGGLCSSSSTPPTWRGPHVEIEGVVRM
jgi:hypothetical protein